MDRLAGLQPGLRGPVRPRSAMSPAPPRAPAPSGAAAIPQRRAAMARHPQSSQPQTAAPDRSSTARLRRLQPVLQLACHSVPARNDVAQEASEGSGHRPSSRPPPNPCSGRCLGADTGQQRQSGRRSRIRWKRTCARLAFRALASGRKPVGEAVRRPGAREGGCGRSGKRAIEARTASTRLTTSEPT